MKNFINFDDFDKESVEEAIEIGIKEKNKFYSENFEIKLNKKFGVLLFEKPSLRTKLSFVKALNFNGINDIYFSPEEVGLGKRQKVSDVAKVISKMSEENLNKVFKYFGEEKFSKRIARKIIDIRQTKKINTEDLTKIVDSVKKFQKYKINNSTKVFQALRIYVNREISELINGLINAFNLLPVGGIIVVVTFHSIEDKIVKFFFKNYSEIKNSSRYIPNKSNKIKRFLLKNKKPIIPSNEELKLNPPSRSAKLRFAIKTTHESNFDEFKGKFRQLTDIEKLQFEKWKKYFENELVEADIENFNWVNIENSNTEILKITSNNE